MDKEVNDDDEEVVNNDEEVKGDPGNCKCSTKIIKLR